MQFSVTLGIFPVSLHEVYVYNKVNNSKDNYVLDKLDMMIEAATCAFVKSLTVS